MAKIFRKMFKENHKQNYRIGKVCNPLILEILEIIFKEIMSKFSRFVAT